MNDFTACIVGPTDGWTLAPAGHRRPWMDATHGQFAYRCLPLVMANQSGWTLGCPAGFEVVWDGGERPDALRVRVDNADESAAKQILTHFGHGILTFSIPWLFRTPPGWNLLVGGVPNQPKVGAWPLEGLVETDWSPFTFTMNWKILEANRPVRFEKGEGVCMVRPVRVGELEELRPRQIRLDDDPALKQEFETWRDSRNAFIDDPDRKMGDWQKDYFKGLNTRGEKAAIVHRSKLRLGAFDGADRT